MINPIEAPSAAEISLIPSMSKLLAFYDSAEYAPLKSLRMNASDSRIIAVDEAAED